jgi:hypothetical protein
MQEQQQCAGAVLGGFPPGSVGAKQYAGVYRTCGENEGMPHFVGAEEQNSGKHMYRYVDLFLDRWHVHSQFQPDTETCRAFTEGGTIPERGREGVRWRVQSGFVGQQLGSWVEHPLVLTLLVRTARQESCLPSQPARCMHPARLGLSSRPSCVRVCVCVPPRR